MAPQALATLLRSYPKKLITTDDASMFLLMNRKRLDSYINPDARGRAVDQLKGLLLAWSGDPPESVAIDFEDVSLTLEQKIYLPIDGFRGIEVSDPNLLQQQRTSRRFKTPFTLFKEDKHFFIALTLENRLDSGLASDRKTTGQLSAPRAIQLKPGEPRPYISGMRTKTKEPRQRVLYSKFSGVFRSGLKTMNWGSLSGRSVSGGLPSLGKRAR